MRARTFAHRGSPHRCRKGHHDAIVAPLRNPNADRLSPDSHNLFRIVGPHTSNQPIAALQDRLDEARFFGVIAEDSAELGYERVNTSSVTNVSDHTVRISALWRQHYRRVRQGTQTCITFGSRRTVPAGPVTLFRDGSTR